MTLASRSKKTGVTFSPHRAAGAVEGRRAVAAAIEATKRLVGSGVGDDVTELARQALALLEAARGALAPEDGPTQAEMLERRLAESRKHAPRCSPPVRATGELVRARRRP